MTGRSGGRVEKVRTYRDLEVWQESYAQCRLVYELSRRFPREETYGLTAQVRRAQKRTDPASVTGSPDHRVTRPRED